MAIDQHRSVSDHRGVLMTKLFTGKEHHLAAADHHDQAARHHRQASRHYEEKDHAHAAHQALIAHGHTQQAVRHGNEATKYHVEHHGKDVPTTETIVATEKGEPKH
jgi:hypothetical protein